MRNLKLAILLLVLIIGSVSADTVSNFSTGQSSLVSIPFSGSNTSTTFPILKYASVNSSYFNLTGLNPINNLGFEAGDASEWNFIGGGGATNTLPPYILSTYVWSGNYYFESFVEATSGCDSGYLNRVLYKSNQSELTILAYANYHYRIGATSPLNYSDFDLSLYNETGKVATLYSNNVSSEYSSNITINLNLNSYQGSVFTLNLTQNACTASGGGIWYSDFLIDIAHTSNVTANINGGSNFYNSNGYFNYNNQTSNFTSQLQTYLNSCTADLSGYCYVPLNISSNTPGLINLSNLNITYSFSAGLTTSVFDQDTLSIINGTTLLATNSTNQFTFNLTFSGNATIFIPYNSLPTGSVTLTYSKTGYQSSTYYITNNNLTVNNQTAYLFNTSSPTAIFTRLHVQNQIGGAIVGAVITVYKPFNSTYTLIGQFTTDGTGTASSTFDSSVVCQMVINASGYQNISQTIQFVQNDYYFSLAPSTANEIILPGGGIFWNLEPYQVSNQLQTFSFNVSTNGTVLVEYVRLTLMNVSNSLILNSTSNLSAPYGANLSFTYNTSTFSGNTVLIGTIKPLNSTSELNYYIAYTLSTVNATNNAPANAPIPHLISIIRNSQAPPIARTLFAFIIIGMVLFYFRLRRINENALLFLVVGLTAAFAYLELIDWYFFFIAFLITIAVWINRSELP